MSNALQTIRRILNFVNDNWALSVVALLTLIGTAGTLLQEGASGYVICVYGGTPYDYNTVATDSLVGPFTVLEGVAITLVALGVYAFCKLRGARPNPPAPRLHADPLQEAMDGANRIYVSE